MYKMYENYSLQNTLQQGFLSNLNYTKHHIKTPQKLSTWIMHIFYCSVQKAANFILTYPLGYFTGIGTMLWSIHCQWSKPGEYWEIIHMGHKEVMLQAYQ